MDINEISTDLGIVQGTGKLSIKVPINRFHKILFHSPLRKFAKMKWVEIGDYVGIAYAGEMWKSVSKASE